MIHSLTGYPVSAEMEDFLEDLHNGKMTLEEATEKVFQLPEIKDAENRLHKGRDTSTFLSRELERSEAEETLNRFGSAKYEMQEQADGSQKPTLTMTGAVRHEKRIDLVIGLPSAGKSTALVEPISAFYQSKICDSDEAKKLLKEFDNGWGASVVHNESKKILDSVLEQAMSREENIVFPFVGGDADKVIDRIKQAKAAGYKVYLHLNQVSPHIALERMIRRFLERGRYLPPNLILEEGRKPEQTFEQLKGRSDLIDGYSKWNNEVERGEPPRFIEGAGIDWIQAGPEQLFGALHEDYQRSGRNGNEAADRPRVQESRAGETGGRAAQGAESREAGMDSTVRGAQKDGRVGSERNYEKDFRGPRKIEDTGHHRAGGLDAASHEDSGKNQTIGRKDSRSESRGSKDGYGLNGNIVSIEPFTSKRKDGSEINGVNLSLVFRDENKNKAYKDCVAYGAKAAEMKDFKRGDFINLYGYDKVTMGKDGKEFTKHIAQKSSMLKTVEQQQQQKALMREQEKESIRPSFAEMKASAEKILAAEQKPPTRKQPEKDKEPER